MGSLLISAPLILRHDPDTISPPSVSEMVAQRQLLLLGLKVDTFGALFTESPACRPRPATSGALAFQSVLPSGSFSQGRLDVPCFRDD